MWEIMIQSPPGALGRTRTFRNPNLNEAIFANEASLLYSPPSQLRHAPNQAPRANTISEIRPALFLAESKPFPANLTHVL